MNALSWVLAEEEFTPKALEYLVDETLEKGDFLDSIFKTQMIQSMQSSLKETD